MIFSGKTKLKPVSRASPCRICGKDHKCSIGEDGLYICGGNIKGKVHGFNCLGPAEGDSQFTLYREEGDQRGRPSNGHTSNGKSTPSKKTEIDWNAKAKYYAADLKPEARSELARTLGIPEAVLSTLSIGYGKGMNGPFWAFPTVDGNENIIGLDRRYRDGTKKAFPDCHRGLTVPAGWKERCSLDSSSRPTASSGFPYPFNQIFFVEGASDTLVLTAMGLCAIGRPSNLTGAEQIAQLLSTLPPDGEMYRRVIVLGEYDPKPDGSWPGLTGAVTVSTKLQTLLKDGFQVWWALPPDHHKDLREWAKAQKLDPYSPKDWHAAAEKLIRALEDKLQEVKKPDAETTPAFVWSPIDSKTFANTDYKPVWLVRQILVRGQTCFIGGPRKNHKTTIVEDLAISLGSATPFLGHFPVYKTAKVAMLSGESGEFTLQETANRICQARGIELANIQENILWQFTLPQLAKSEDLADLKKGLEASKVEVLILDPLYLSLLAGQGPNGIKAENLFDMGPLLSAITRACLEVGTTPALIHHTKKDTAKRLEVLDLDDLAYAGVAEFARQWMLLSRREKYDQGSGIHKLWLNVGGSTGHGGLWALDIDEGVIGDDFRGRKWAVSLATGAEVREKAGNDKQQSKFNQEKADDAKLLLKIDQSADRGESAIGYTKARDLTGLSGPKMAQCVDRLISAQIIERAELEITAGKGAKRKVEGLRRRQPGSSDHRADG